jgi:hypothetical protein
MARTAGGAKTKRVRRQPVLRAEPLPLEEGAPRRPLDLLAPYLGKRRDEWFAERIGRSIQTIAAMRLQAGMLSFGERCRLRLPITVPDAEIERAIAAFKNARKKYRHRGPTPGPW